MKRIIQIMAVTFALLMLAAYVVYSQKQQNRTVAPGSKVLSPPESSGGRVATGNGTAASAASTATNGYSFSDAVASSSKFVSPVIKVQTDPTRSSDWIAPSTSKSGRVFDRSITQGFGGTSAKLPLDKTETSVRKSLAATNAPLKKASP